MIKKQNSRISTTRLKIQKKMLLCIFDQRSDASCTWEYLRSKHTVSLNFFTSVCMYDYDAINMNTQVERAYLSWCSNIIYSVRFC